MQINIISQAINRQAFGRQKCQHLFALMATDGSTKYEEAILKDNLRTIYIVLSTEKSSQSTQSAKYLIIYKDIYRLAVCTVA